MVRVKINTHKKGRPPFVDASLAAKVQSMVDAGSPFKDALLACTATAPAPATVAVPAPVAVAVSA